MLNQTTVVIRAKKGRHVFVGENKLPDNVWSEHPVTPSIIKAIRVGDVVEGKPEDLAPEETKPEKAVEDKK